MCLPNTLGSFSKCFKSILFIHAWWRLPWPPYDKRKHNLHTHQSYNRLLIMHLVVPDNGRELGMYQTIIHIKSTNHASTNHRGVPLCTTLQPQLFKLSNWHEVHRLFIWVRIIFLKHPFLVIKVQKTQQKINTYPWSKKGAISLGNKVVYMCLSKLFKLQVRNFDTLMHLQDFPMGRSYALYNKWHHFKIRCFFWS
jgi:hypothetical protein